LGRPRPNLFIVGAPRSGTTSLHSLLAQHPEAFMSAAKEPHFFASDVNRRYEEHAGRRITSLYRTLDEYLALFAGSERAKVRGESSVYYLYSDAAADAIQAFDPRAKIVVMLREPVSFLHSLHGRLRSMADETCADFERALALEPERRAGRELPRSVRLPELLHYSRYTRFAEGIERYVARFGRERVHVILFDDYQSDRRRVWDELLAFLELAPSPLPAHDEQNPHHEPRWIWLTVALRERVHWSLAGGQRGTRGLARRARQRLYRALERFNWRAGERAPLAPDVRARLERGLSGEVQRLSELLERDLVALWGYGGR
jgi:hypothetical protein